MSNVTDLADFLEKRKAAETKYTVLEQFSVHHSQLTIPLQSKFAMIRDLALRGALKGKDVRGFYIASLAAVAEELFRGVFLPFNMLTTAAVRESNEVDGKLSMMIFGATVDNYTKADGDSNKLDAGFYVLIDLDQPFPTTGIRSVNTVKFNTAPGCGVSYNQIHQLLLNMEALAITNNGVAFVADNGRYMVGLPYSPTQQLSIQLVNSLPFETLENPTGEH